MSRNKIVTGFLILAAVIFATWQISPALAAAGTVNVTTTPAAPINGTVQSVVLHTDAATAKTTVSVTITEAAGATRSVDMSLESATALGLVTLDASGAPLVNSEIIGKDVSIDPLEVSTLPDDKASSNPVNETLAGFFGIDPAIMAEYHAKGVGYGVIAQACWMSYRLVGDASMCKAILDARNSDKLNTITMPDGSTVSVGNWGQFKKTNSDQKGPHQNLGGIMSGHADPILPGVTPGHIVPGVTPVPGMPIVPPQNGRGTNGNNGNGNQNGNGNGNGNGSNGNGMGHGNGRP